MRGLAAVGNQGLIQGKAARILEVGGPQAALQLTGLCEQMIRIPPKVAIIHTTDSKEQWQDALSESLRYDPAEAATRVRWRRSAHGGGIWAKAQQLETAQRGLVSMARASKGRREELAATVEVSYQGALGARPWGLLTAMAEKAGEKQPGSS